MGTCGTTKVSFLRRQESRFGGAVCGLVIAIWRFLMNRQADTVPQMDLGTGFAGWQIENTRDYTETRKGQGSGGRSDHTHGTYPRDTVLRQRVISRDQARDDSRGSNRPSHLDSPPINARRPCPAQPICAPFAGQSDRKEAANGADQVTTDLFKDSRTMADPVRAIR